MDKKDTSLDQYDFATPEAEVVVPEAPPLVPEAADAPAASGSPPKGAGGKFHSTRLVLQAKALGIPDEELADIEPKELQGVINAARIEQALGRRESEIHSKMQSTPQPEPAQPVVQNAPPEQEFDWGLNDDGTPLKAEDYPLVTRTLVKMVQDLKAELSGIKGYVQNEANSKAATIVDQGFKDLGPGFERIFGKGNGDELHEGNPAAFKLRLQVLKDLKENPIKGARGEKAIAQRARELFGHLADVTQTEASPAPPAAPTVPEPKPSKNGTPAPEAITRARWNAGVTAAPSNRNGAKEPKGVGTAKKAFQAGMAERQAVLAASGEADDQDSFD